MINNDNQCNPLQPATIDDSSECTPTWKRRVEEAWDRSIALMDEISEGTERNMEKLRKSVKSMGEQGES